MNNLTVGNLVFSQILQRKIDFLLTNNISPWNEDDKSDQGELDALNNMLRDTSVLTEQQFESKYLAELAVLKERFENKEYSVNDDDDYYETYNNTLVDILELINPINRYDLSD